MLSIVTRASAVQQSGYQSSRHNHCPHLICPPNLICPPYCLLLLLLIYIHYLCTSCPPLPPSPPFDKTMHGDSLAISKNPNPPFKYKASQCGESDPNTASQSDSSKDCTHSKGVNQLGAMSHSEPVPFFSRCCYRRRAVYSAS